MFDIMFQQATRLKLRWTHKGQISVEDLWNLTPTELNEIAKALNSELQKQEVSFLPMEQTIGDAELTLKLEIVKFIIATKIAEQKAKKESAEVAQQRQELLELLHEKQKEQMRQMSPEQIQEMLAKLG